MDSALILSGVIVVGLLLILFTMARMYRKVGPHTAMIVYGLGGSKVVTNSGAVVWPLVQTAQELSLELMSFDVVPQQDFYTVQGVAVTVEAVAQIKVKNDRESILTAAEQFLTRTEAQRHDMMRLVMEGHLRGIIGQLTVESIVKEPEMVADRMRANVAQDLDKMGLEVISFTIKEIRDKNDYISNMGKPDIWRIQMQANIAGAEAERDTAIKRAEAIRAAAVAKAAADQERVIAETASETRQAEAQRDLALKQAEYQATVKKAQAEADAAYDIEKNVQQQRVVVEQVRVERAQREEQIAVQEAEIQRREKELVATVLKPAEVEKQRVETLALAEQRRLAIEAEGQAQATKFRGNADADVAKVKGSADADVIKVRGSAEADIIRAKGEAEAQAMHLKADAYQAYSQAAVLDKLIGSLPELARAMAEPLNKVDRITVVSTGSAPEVGVHKITADLARMIAQAPALVESLTGMKVSDILHMLPGLAEKIPAAIEAPAAREAAATGESGHK